MPSASRPERSLKKASAEAQRRAMNERRSEYTNRIRKAKKAHLVTLKRRYMPPTPDTSASTSKSSMETLAWEYVRSKSLESLAGLQSALATSTDTFSLPQESTSGQSVESPAMQLANALAESLVSNNLEVRLLASRVLTNLAAMEQQREEDDMGYYGRQPEGWCNVLIHSKALPALVQNIAIFSSEVDPSYMSSDGPVLEVCQQCCWAIGNLAGDSQMARDATRQAGVVQPLVTVLSKGMEIKHTSICRDAAWALSNLTRGVTTSGKEFCGPSLLTPVLVASVLMSPKQQLSTTVVSSWWTDVAKEMCWVLAFLSAREDEVVDFLCQPSTELAWLMPETQNVVCAALSHRLEQASRIVRTASKELGDNSLRALRMTIPCLRSIGNIATACEGRHVKTLVMDTKVLESLALLLEAGFTVQNSDVAAVAVEAAWAAGTLLCDAGLEGHSSTTHACPTLLPILCKTVTSEYAKLDLKREALSALRNASQPPPNPGNETSFPVLVEIIRTIASFPGMIVALVDALTCPDADAVLASLELINAMLRQHVVEPTRFMEANIVDALEAVCDRASQDNSYGGGKDWQGDGSRSADIAADLIDDFFGIDIDDAMDENETRPMPNAFSFAAPDSQSTFDFGGMQPQSQALSGASGGSASMGRGRGRPVPSWMQNT